MPLLSDEACTVVASDGTIRATRKAKFAGRELVIVAATADAVIEPGDEIRRRLPNGTEEAFEVIDPTFYNAGVAGMGPHFQIKVRRKGTFPLSSGGNYTFHVSGSNSRVNVGSQDNSVNVVADSIFGDVAAALRNGIGDQKKLDEILAALEDMKRERGRAGFLHAYQKFIGVCADHLGLVSPFLPALTSLIGGA